jgi:hypothetical protein
MFNGGFAEATTNSAEMPDDDPDIFDSFIEWLYRGVLDTTDKLTANHEGGPMWKRIKLYCLAEKYCIDTLSDAAIDTIIDGFTGICIRADSICLAYQNTTDGAALRSYMSGGFAFEISRMNESNTEEEMGRLANISDFARDVFCHFASKKKEANTNPDRLPRCHFHRHGKDKPCNQSGQISRE